MHSLENSDKQSMDTIFALASGSGRAGVSVIRISGPDAHKACRALLGGKLPKARRASLRTVQNPYDGSPIDQALVLRFNGPASFTGEDLVELQLHGSTAVVQAVASALFALGLRQAVAGEFTRRAFDNGRMDLTEAEGLADLIDAESEAQRQQAYRQMDGGLRRIYEDWRSQLLDALAAIEGEIDFPDEQDVPDKLSKAAGPGLDALIGALSKALEDSQAGERIRHGVDIAIIGPPNAGKSTIINSLVKKNAAIVSDEAGTTRDIVEVPIDIAGVPVRLSDTAGLRETESRVEAEGVRRARVRAESADLRIGVIDISDQSALPDIVDQLSRGDIIVFNKTDLVDGVDAPLNVSRETFTVLQLSAKDGERGIAALRGALESIIAQRYSVREDAGLTRARHRDCVSRAKEALANARQNLDIAPELSGEDMRRALHAIKELAGEADIDAVLDRIFSRFCIGK